MKQKISALLLAALYLFILSGCKEAGTAPPPAALCAQIAGAVSFEAPLTEADAETACALYGFPRATPKRPPGSAAAAMRMNALFLHPRVPVLKQSVPK